MEEQRVRFVVSLFILTFIGLAGAPVAHAESALRFVEISAQNKFERTEIANAGVSIEAFRPEGVWGFATDEAISHLQSKGFKLLAEAPAEALDFPAEDSRFRNYSELIQAITDLKNKNPELITVQSIGKSTEGRDLLALRFNTSQATPQQADNKPGVIFMGGHHAREHVSMEIPLMFAEYLAKNKNDIQIKGLLANRDIWIIPMVNPDGAEYDIGSGNYRSWRKNRRTNGDGTFGVDLNRNYGYKWGTGGSSNNTNSDVYMGPSAFSEPETKAIKAFVESRKNTKVLLSFHTYSELILYPWGHSYDPIVKENDHRVFETMAKTMAQWNNYTPEQSSSLYITSGDTTDWAYGELGIFAFTFELSPKDMWDGGFYPGAKVLDKVFQDNLKPVLYLTDLADDPYRALNSKRPSPWLKSLVEDPIQPSWL